MLYFSTEKSFRNKYNSKLENNVCLTFCNAVICTGVQLSLGALEATVPVPDMLSSENKTQSKTENYM